MMLKTWRTIFVAVEGGFTIGSSAVSKPRNPKAKFVSIKSENACADTQQILPFSIKTPSAEPGLQTASALSLHCSSVQANVFGDVGESHL